MRRAEVVEVDWTYSDLTGSKVRPAVVVQADFLNGLIDDTILVQITSTRHGIPGTEVLIDPAVETGSGLSRVCYASCANILTRDQALLGRTIGFLSDALMRQIGDCLELPDRIATARHKLLGNNDFRPWPGVLSGSS
jgi:mRNA-degrading endonuclease toxin of MazEF toxin-antitoxin module